MKKRMARRFFIGGEAAFVVAFAALCAGAMDVSESLSREMSVGQFPLDGEWQLRQGGREPIPCRIPGDNYSALLDAGFMPDPFVGTNEWRVQQFADEDAVFSRTFDAPEGFYRIVLATDKLSFGVMASVGGSGRKDGKGGSGK